MQPGRVSRDVLLGKGQKHDRVYPALEDHPCPALLCSEYYKDATRYDPHGRAGRINHGHLESAWDLGESLLKVNPRELFPYCLSPRNEQSKQTPLIPCPNHVRDNTAEVLTQTNWCFRERN